MTSGYNTAQLWTAFVKTIRHYYRIPESTLNFFAFETSPCIFFLKKTCNEKFSNLILVGKKQTINSIKKKKLH